jgi:hypothetical protein
LFKLAHAAAIAAVFVSTPLESQRPAPAPVPSLTYADLADLAITAPVAAHVRVDDATRLRPQEAPGLAPGKTRFYVEADVVSLIRSSQGLPARVSYLVDLPNDPKGRPPKLRGKSEFIVLAARVRGRPAELRLVGPAAHLPYSSAYANRLRSILREATAPDAPPAIVGVGRAFHVKGSLPGESETQIFLLAADQRPVSLTILRRPGQAPAWAVALTEIVDNAAAPPARDTLLWYRLACSLPRTLPPQSVADTDPAEAGAIRADYRLVLDRLGPCARSRRAA